MVEENDCWWYSCGGDWLVVEENESENVEENESENVEEVRQLSDGGNSGDNELEMVMAEEKKWWW